MAVKQPTQTPERSRFIGVRLQPDAQVNLEVILETGEAESITEAVHKALQREARAAKRRAAQS